MKKFFVTIAILAVLAVPTAVFAHSQAVQSALYFACENSTSGQVDANSITQDDALDCSNNGAFTSKVQWSVTGPQGPAGTNGTDGAPGPAGSQGPKGDTGPAGVPFTHAPCTETLSGVQQQENMVFCLSGIEPDGGLVYKAAIGAAAYHIIVGTPIDDHPSVDWGSQPLKGYVEFTSGFHAEYHADNVMRIYNTLNQRVY